MKQLALKKTKAAKKEDRVANGGIHRTIKRTHPKQGAQNFEVSVVCWKHRSLLLIQTGFIRFYFTSCLIIIASIPSVNISRCL